MDEDPRLVRIEAKVDQIQLDVAVLKAEVGYAKKGALALLALCGAVVTWVIALLKG